jgi:hypothetical protein
MAQIVRECDSFCQFRGEAVAEERLFDEQIVRDGSGYLRRLDTVSQARAVKVRLPDAENLRLPLKSAECGAVKYAVTVSFGGMPMILGRGRALAVPALQQKIIHG